MTLDPKGAGRRSFLRTAAGAAALLPAMQSLDLLAKGGRAYAQSGGYGALIPTADLRDGVSRLALPAGFSYRSFSLAGETMDDGHLVPLAHDGMGLFNSTRDRGFRLVRNHEDRNGPGTGSTQFLPTGYDPLGGGGTTTLIIDPITRTLRRHFLSATGTYVNCAGGITPWGTWITCEETNAGVSSGWTKQHGYCFEVRAQADGAEKTVPIPEMGRFAHEAVAVDDRTGYVYETEDNGRTNSGLYRFKPTLPGILTAGGQLEQLAVVGSFQANLYNAGVVGQDIPVTWVPIADPNPPGTSSTAVFSQGRALGAAAFARLEGIWWDTNEQAMYFTSTNGGAAQYGQVWRLRTSREGGVLTLIYESPSQSVLDFPDTLTVSPRGVVLLCEDGGGEQYMRGVTLAGGLFDFALNIENGYEWAGACFGVAESSWVSSPRVRPTAEQRTTLFVNRQGSTGGSNPPAPGDAGMTFAIWGPWNNGAL